MNRQELLKAYLKQRGMRVLDSATKRFQSDVYMRDAMSEAEIQKRIDDLDIQDLDETVNDSGDDLPEDEPKDEPKSDDKKSEFPKDLGYGITLLEENPSNEYRG